MAVAANNPIPGAWNNYQQMVMWYQHRGPGASIGGTAGGGFTLQPEQCLEALPLEAFTPYEGVEPRTYSSQPVRAQRERKRQRERSAVASAIASVMPGATRRERQEQCERQE